MDKTTRIAGAVLAIILIGAAILFVAPLLNPPKVSATAPSHGLTTVYFFYGEECPHCHEVRPFVENLSQNYPDVEFQYLETWHNQTNQEFAATLNRKLGIQETRVPRVIIGDKMLLGSGEIPANLEALIIEKKN